MQSKVSLILTAIFLLLASCAKTEITDVFDTKEDFKWLKTNLKGSWEIVQTYQNNQWIDSEGEFEFLPNGNVVINLNDEPTEYPYLITRLDNRSHINIDGEDYPVTMDKYNDEIILENWVRLRKGI